MKKELEKLRKNLFIEIRACGGLGSMPGTDGTIITKDNKVYNYHDYWEVPEEMKDKIPLQYISEGKELKPTTIKKLNNYIKKHIAEKWLCPTGSLMYDAHFHLTINFNNELIELTNYDYINYKIMDIIEKNEKGFYCTKANPVGYSVHTIFYDL